MVTYGPWVEPIEYTETWTFGLFAGGEFGLTGVSIDPVPQADGVPLTYSQWRARGGLQPNAVFSGDRTTTEYTFDGDLNDGRYGTPQVSSDAWDELYTFDEFNSAEVYGGSINPGENAVEPPTILYSSSDDFEPGSFGYKVHRENWYASSVELVPEWVIRTFSNSTLEAILGIPAHDEDVWYEVDPTRNAPARYSEPISLSVTAVTADSRWKLFVVDTDTPAVDWRVSGSESSPTLLFDALRNMGQVRPDGTFEFDVAPVEAWKQEAGFSTSYWVDRNKMPHVGIAWDAPWPGLSLAEPTEIPALPTITLTYTWQSASWRFVYPDVETVPYRRVYPRDDGLAGGARRNYPPSRATQSSNRTSGGYL